MSLISSSYFIKDIALPVGTDSNITNEIAKYEPEILKRLLGYELWKLVNDSPADPPRIKDLVEGVDYTVAFNGRDQAVRWNGFANTELISLIAYYTYYWSQRNSASNTSTTGESKPKQENSTIIAANVKVGNAWHRLRELYGYKGQHILEPSAYNFLKEHEDDYEEWVFDPLKGVNMFGI